MKVHVGIDLGSTTTKAVVLTDDEQILGRGITNSRSNYDVACAIARSEAFTTARFALLRREIEADLGLADQADAAVRELERLFRKEQHDRQLAALHDRCVESLRGSEDRAPIEEIFEGMREKAAGHFAADGKDGGRSDFFRDIAASHFLELAESVARRGPARFDRMMSLFDRSILIVENAPPDLTFESNIRTAAARAFAGGARAEPGGAKDEAGGARGAAPDRTVRRDLPPPGTVPAGGAAHSGAGARLVARIGRAVETIAETPLDEAGAVGTGYGRARLPFPKESIRSEILCHGLGAHYFFPRTATVLDIGGQDTKAIQVDADGIVTGFQMNDRCAAGCGRYLGYIADEMNLGLHELGPLAQRSCSPTRIASTCTVFAGAELRERLSLGEKREDILAGLHRAIILRAMSLLARSGGVKDEFTFTGGVAKNPAALGALRRLVEENYGERRLNVSPDSIYTGAVGAALFSSRAGARAAAA